MTAMFKTDIESIINNALEFFEKKIFITDGIPVNVIETKESASFELFVPGFKKENISVTLNGDTLKIEGKRTVKEDYTFAQYKTASFKKEIEINTRVIDKDSLSAKMEDGVLYISLKKAKEASSSVKVEIK